MSAPMEHEAALAQTLGRLPAVKKAEFIRKAEAILEQAQRARPPSAEEYQALAVIAEKARELSNSIQFACRSPKARAYLQNAWREVAARTPDELPDMPQNLVAALQRLSEAASLWLPPEQPSNRPLDFSVRTLALISIQGIFREVFGRPPTYGNGSPFVRFCREAFPNHGFAVPSTGKMRDPAGIGAEKSSK